MWDCPNMGHSERDMKILKRDGISPPGQATVEEFMGSGS